MNNYQKYSSSNLQTPTQEQQAPVCLTINDILGNIEQLARNNNESITRASLIAGNLVNQSIKDQSDASSPDSIVEFLNKINVLLIDSTDKAEKLSDYLNYSLGGIKIK